jgi:antitoxin (DNA-binding transcriptional repressor) of toxin-antitoxin stability system
MKTLFEHPVGLGIVRRCDTKDTTAVKTVSIRDLHSRTGQFVRRASIEPFVVTDYGRTVARLVPVSEPTGIAFADRRLRPGFKRFLDTGFVGGTDSAQSISEDRARR